MQTFTHNVDKLPVQCSHRKIFKACCHFFNIMHERVKFVVFLNYAIFVKTFIVFVEHISDEIWISFKKRQVTFNYQVHNRAIQSDKSNINSRCKHYALIKSNHFRKNLDFVYITTFGFYTLFKKTIKWKLNYSSFKLYCLE